MATKAKNQHFVPRGILKNFAFDKNQIYQMDKTNEKIVPSSLDGIANKRYFYNYKNQKKSLEQDFFGVIDDNASKVITKILYDRTIKTLTKKENKNLIKFIASQICRVPLALRLIKEINEDLTKELGQEFSIIKEDTDTDFLNSIVTDTKIYEDYLNKKLLHLIEVEYNYFITSDNPVIKIALNEKAEVVFGHITPIINRDIFMMPISSRFLLILTNFDFKYDIRRLAQINNSYQFIQSNKYIFSHSEDILKDEIKEYYKYAFQYVESIRPDFIQKYNIEFGQPLYIDTPRVTFNDSVKEKISSK